MLHVMLGPRPRKSRERISELTPGRSVSWGLRGRSRILRASRS
jgi:hypothetical protein